MPRRCGKDIDPPVRLIQRRKKRKALQMIAVVMRQEYEHGPVPVYQGFAQSANARAGVQHQRLLSAQVDRDTRRVAPIASR